MSIHPVALTVVLCVALAVAALPRDKVLAPLFLVAVFLPLAQGFQVGGLDFNFARFLIFVAILRFAIRGEFGGSRWNSVDTAMLVWCSLGSITFVLLWGTVDAVVNRLGQFVNYAGTYLIVRVCVRTVGDIEYLSKYMRLAATLLGVCMLVESQTGRNLFAVFGGVPEVTWIRDGRLRAQGPFGHPIAAGLFAASLVPIFAGCVLARVQRLSSVAAIGTSLFAVVATASSAPVLGLAGGVAGWGFWPIRRHLRKMLWAGVVGLVVLHFSMKAPVWALIQRVSVFGGSSSYHRYNLFDQFLRRFDEWWLVGTTTTDHWGYFSQDVANNYVRIGVNGGVFTLLAYLWMLRQVFAAVGAAVRHSSERRERLLLWSLGASLMVHVVGSFGVSYWDQSMFLFPMLIGLVSATSTAVLSRDPSAAPQQQATQATAWLKIGARAVTARPVDSRSQPQASSSSRIAPTWKWRDAPPTGRRY